MAMSIEEFVARKGRPDVVSLAEDTHIFHFSDSQFWEDSPLLFVNRNGHQFRLMPGVDSFGVKDWLFAKTWNGMLNVDPWMTEANLRRADPAVLINLCGIGPQSRRIGYETLCLLPGPATTGRRKAAWRNNLLDTSFNRQDDSFTISTPENHMRAFKGKLWESKEAADWCREQFAEAKIVVTKKIEPLREEALVGMDENPLWGAF